MCLLMCSTLHSSILDGSHARGESRLSSDHASVLAQCVLPSPVTVLAKEESGSNSLGFIIGDYDVKEKEKEKKDSYQSYDKTGPKLENATVVNAGGTSESIKETVNNDSVNSNGGKFNLCNSIQTNVKTNQSSCVACKAEFLLACTRV